MEIAELLTLKEKLEKLKEIIEKIGEYRDRRRSAENAEALESVDETVGEIARELIGDPAAEAALDGYLAEHAQGYKVGADIFTPEYRERIKAGFLTGRSGLLGFGDVSGETIDRYLDKLDQLLHAVLTPDSVLILRWTVSNNDKLNEIAQSIQMGNKKLDQICKALRIDAPRVIRTSNKQYRDDFTKPLFLHKNIPDTKVRLKNLFVPQRFCISGNTKPAKEALTDYLARFIQQEDMNHRPPFLFIEGDARCGKSSFAAYLNYYYWNDVDFRRKVFGECQLVTVRLREIDIPDTGAAADRLKDGILNFLNTDEDELREARPILFLDGYDELCTIEELRDAQSALYGLRNLLRNVECKAIVTARPRYIRIEEFSYPHTYITLQHSDKDQRAVWLKHYEIDCGETIAEKNRQYLERIDTEGDPAGICDTLMGLYMVAAEKGFQAGELENEWALYHRIFSRQLSETTHNFREHAIAEKPCQSKETYQEIIYRVSEEMAYYLYQKKNADLLIPNQAVQDIVKEFKIQDTRTAKIIEDCYALCGYWKVSADRLCVEFYHNNIRDFFLCEKIMRELNDAYQKYEVAIRDPNADITPFLKRLCTLFQYGELEKRVLDFLRLRSFCNVASNFDDCIKLEKSERFLSRIFETLLTTGSAYTVIPAENPTKTVSHILANVVQVYERLYEAILKKNEYVQLWKDRDKINSDGMLRLLSSKILKYAPRANLRGTTLTHAYLNDANLSGASLSAAWLSGAYLTRADLSNAHLIMAYLNDADLTRVNLSGACLTRADLTRVSLSGAWLIGADLLYADLSDAQLIGAHLRGAHLTDANLTGANLTDADLSGADLSGANLTDADLTNAHMENCKLDGARLHNCNLQNAIGVSEKYLPEKKEPYVAEAIGTSAMRVSASEWQSDTRFGM